MTESAHELDPKLAHSLEQPEETQFSYQEKLHGFIAQAEKAYANAAASLEKTLGGLKKLFTSGESEQSAEMESSSLPASANQESPTPEVHLQGQEFTVEIATPESVESVEALQEEARAITSETLEKVSGQLGSNEGGWYEDQVTQQRFYTKFYKNPDQARVEYIANAIYEKLGIHAVHAQLLEMGGQLAIASEEVAGAQATWRDEQQQSADVRNGFVADAYLGNWDVVGLNYDNIVKGSDGALYRIDNGGSMTFRAQGGVKEFSPDSIPELENMRKPEFPAGKVFDSLAEDDLRTQAEQVVNKLDDAFIEEVVAKAGLRGPLAEQITVALKGRRQVLVERFGIADSSEHPRRTTRLPRAISRLQEIHERISLEHDPFPKVEIVADRDSIEGQQMSIVENLIENRYEVVFKLTEAQYNRVTQQLFAQDRTNPIPTNAIVYAGRGDSYSAGHSWHLTHGNIAMEVAQKTEWRSLHGQVRMFIPKTGDEPLDPEKMNDDVQSACRELLGIEDALAEPDEASMREYKNARYTWHHKLPEVDPNTFMGIEKRLHRDEVFPEYSTIVEQDKHKEYQEQYGRYFFRHKLHNPDTLTRIIKSGGLMATHERLRRGMLVYGMSSGQDMGTGGADSVFLRHYTEGGKAVDEKNYSDTSPFTEELTLVFKNRIADRTDWYAYAHDEYGGTEKEKMQNRLSPNQLFEQTLKRGNSPYWKNEEMFRTGIRIEDIGAVITTSSSAREDALQRLQEAGISEVNGKPIEEFVIVVEFGVEEAIRIASDGE